MNISTHNPYAYPQYDRFMRRQAQLHEAGTPATPSPQPAPPAPLPPAPPSPPVDVDFSHIDTPEKAALLPALNPAAIAAVAAAVLAGGGKTPVEVDFYFGDITPGAIEYQVSDGEMPPMLIAKGQILPSHEGQLAVPIQEMSKFDNEKTLHISGNIGSSQEDITITADKEHEVAHLDGKIGDIEVHQTISQSADGKNSVIADGTLGGLAFHQEVTPEMDEAGPRILVNGNLGDKPIQTTAGMTRSENAMIIHGEGTIAGTYFNVDCSVAANDKSKFAAYRVFGGLQH